jgi:hypothetical protein
VYIEDTRPEVEKRSEFRQKDSRRKTEETEDEKWSLGGASVATLCLSATHWLHGSHARKG